LFYYQKKFLKEGGLTVIHSTVAVGVCDDLRAVHSPVIGQHPNMEEYIRKATKIFGGKRAYEAAEYFRRIGLKVLIYDTARESELAKLYLTECYRLNIEFCHRVKRNCKRLGLNFHNVYTLPSRIYNEIYKEMGHEEYVRQVLEPMNWRVREGRFDIIEEVENGGHCVDANSKLLKSAETM